MRRWRWAAGRSFAFVADRPALWIPGALGWVAGVGWIPFLVAVARPPTQSELTYFGAGMQTSGLWPLNLVVLAAGVVAVVVGSVALVAVANATLEAGIEGRPSRVEDAGRLFVASMLGVLPVALAVFTVLVGVLTVAPQEFTRPDGTSGTPVARLALRLAPVLVLASVVAIGAAGVAGLIGRAATRAGSMAGGLARAGTFLRRNPAPTLAQLVVGSLASIAYLLVCAVLLRVLWAPIGVGLAGAAPIDLPGGLLLVGFIGIWLCLVLAGGALQAWGSATWVLLIGAAEAGSTMNRRQEAGIGR